jgi:hypothetical protein
MAMVTKIDYRDALDSVQDLVNTYFNPTHEVIPTITSNSHLVYNVNTIDDYELLTSNEEVLEQIMNSVLPHLDFCLVRYYPVEVFVENIKKCVGDLHKSYAELCFDEENGYYISVVVHNIDEMLMIYDNIEKIDDLYDKLITDDRIDGYEIIFNL